MPRQRIRRGWRRWVNTVNVSAVVIAVVTALPLYWLVTTSFKPSSEIAQSPPTAFPVTFTLDNFVVAFRDNALGQYMVNSIVVAVSTTVVVLAPAFLAGYALAGRWIRGRTAIMTALLMLSVILPMAKPGLFTVGVFTFTASWSEFLMALTFNSENSFRTIPVGIALFGTQFTVPFAQIFAASVAATVPIVILVLVFRRSIVSGLTSGAVKG